MEEILIAIVQFFTQLIFRKMDKKNNLSRELDKKDYEEFQKKAEFYLDKLPKKNPDISLIMSNFECKLFHNKTPDIAFYYDKDILNSKKYEHMQFYLKNIGGADVNQLDICVCSKQNIMLCGLDEIESLVSQKLVCYNYCYDRKILKNDGILLDISYLKKSKIFNPISSELVLLFKDSYGNSYEQPLFLTHKNLYEPRSINNKEYRSIISVEDAIDAIKDFKKSY